MFAHRNSLEIHSTTILYIEVVKIFVLWHLWNLWQGEAAISNASCAAACTADSKCSAFAVDRDTVEVKCLVYNETAKGCELQGAAMCFCFFVPDIFARANAANAPKARCVECLLVFHT